MDNADEFQSNVCHKGFHNNSPQVFRNMLLLIQIMAGAIALVILGSFVTRIGRATWFVYGAVVLGIAFNVYPGFLGLPITFQPCYISLTTFHVMEAIAAIGCLLGLIVTICGGGDKTTWL